HGGGCRRRSAQMHKGRALFGPKRKRIREPLGDLARGAARVGLDLPQRLYRTADALSQLLARQIQRFAALLERSAERRSVHHALLPLELAPQCPRNCTRFCARKCFRSAQDVCCNAAAGQKSISTPLREVSTCASSLLSSRYSSFSLAWARWYG